MKSTLNNPAIDEEKFLLQGLQLTICLSIECLTFFSLKARHFCMMVSNPYPRTPYGIKSSRYSKYHSYYKNNIS
jgi:hypothetical protein